MLRSRWLPVALACSLLLALWPLWAEPVAALSDWPNHLARVHVLADRQQLIAFDQRGIAAVSMDSCNAAHDRINCLADAQIAPGHADSR